MELYAVAPEVRGRQRVVVPDDPLAKTAGGDQFHAGGKHALAVAD